MTSTMAGARDFPPSPAPHDGAGLDRRTRRIIFLAPLAIVIVCLALCLPPAGRAFYDWLISENKPVEMLTFILALVAAVMAVRLAAALFRRRERLPGAFYVLFAL